MRYYGGSIAQGYVDALNQMQQRALQKQQMEAQKQAMALQAFQLQKQQMDAQQQALAQKNAGQAFGDLAGQPPPQVPVQAMGGAGAPQGMTPGAPAPAPGQASVPAGPPPMPPQGPPPGPPGAPPMGGPGGAPQIPMGGQRPPMAPQPPGPPPGPPPIKPYTAPGAPAAPPGPPQVPVGQGAPPPPQQGMQQPGGITLDQIAKTLSSQGLKGQDLYQALMAAVPLMDSQSKVQMALMDRQMREQQMLINERLGEGRLSQGQQRIEISMDQGNRRLDQAQERIDIAKKKAAAGAAPSSSDMQDPAMRQIWVDQFKKTGKYPQFAWGAAGNADRAAFRQAVAEDALGGGQTGADIATGQANFKSLGQSLNAVQKRTSGIELGARKIEKDIQTLESTMAGNTGFMKFANVPINKLRRQFSDPQMGAFDLAANQVGTEYERMLSGGMLSVAQLHTGAQEDAKKLINGDMSPEEIQAKLPIMLREIQNGREAANEEMSTLKAAMSANAGGAPAPAASAPAAPKPGTVENGYRFKGGDPGKQSSWEKI